MKEKLIGFSYKGKEFNLKVEVLPKYLHWLGLMFSRREKARALLFEFKKPVKMAIHSYFVFFPFIAIWIDSKNEIIDLRVVTPFKFFILPSGKFTKLIEVPINKKYNSLEFRRLKERFK